MTNEPKRGTIPYHMYPFYRVYTEKGEQYCDCGWEKHARELVELNRTCSIVADRKNLYYKKDFFRTGDLGRIDSEGYLFLIGRKKDLIISGGLNVFPKEVELIIDSFPEVKESAVIGLPHPDFGEQVVAVIVLEETVRLDKPTLINKMKNKIASFKIPKEVLFLDELPRNTMGKVQKNILRERFS